jgi:Glycosyl hydrolase family 1
VNILRRAMAEGVDVRGYLHWSVTDNWEWHMTYQPQARFGLYGVDRTQQDNGRLTLPRRPTESAFAMACLANGLPSDVAVRRFGSFTDDGASYVTPSLSACRAWSGQTADGTTWWLVLADLTGGRMLGWVRDSMTTKWVALDQLSGRPDTDVWGAHRRGWGFAEREFALSPNGQDLVGSISPLGSPSQPVTLTRDAFVGTWLGGPWPMVLLPFGLWEKGRPDEPVSPVQPSTPYIGRWLSPSHPKLDGTWLWLKASPGIATGLDLDLGGVMNAVVTVTPGTLSGTVSTVLAVPGLVVPTGTVTWSRALDDLS